jgi:hypothetical protein
VRDVGSVVDGLDAWGLVEVLRRSWPDRLRMKDRDIASYVMLVRDDVVLCLMFVRTL